MALVHKFKLVLKTEENDFYKEKTNRNIQTNVLSNGEQIELSDNIILYILDSLNWVPTYSSLDSGMKYGLNYHGMTYITQEGASIMKKIIKSWASLFSNAPEFFEITGLYTWEDNAEQGKYEKISIKRDEIVDVFTKLAHYAEQVENDDTLCIFHAGI